MVRLFSLLFALFLAVFATAQTAAPGGSDGSGPRLKLEIEGKGTVTIRLYPDKAPKAVAHIVKLTKDGFYDGLRFHRVERTPRPYLVQIGDPQSKSGELNSGEMGKKGTGAKIPYEDSGLQNIVGAVGLVRMDEGRDTGDSQFYILLDAQPFLNNKYTVFGKVTDGMDVVKKIDKRDRVTKATIVGI